MTRYTVRFLGNSLTMCVCVYVCVSVCGHYSSLVSANEASRVCTLTRIIKKRSSKCVCVWGGVCARGCVCGVHVGVIKLIKLVR